VFTEALNASHSAGRNDGARWAAYGSSESARAHRCPCHGDTLHEAMHNVAGGASVIPGVDVLNYLSAPRRISFGHVRGVLFEPIASPG
jgi:hypothetical protein